MQARKRRYHSKSSSQSHRKTRAILSFGLVGFLLLVSHQNCAPADSFATAAAPHGVAIEAPLPVAIIDGSKRDAALSFPFDEMELASNADQIKLLGDCTEEQEGSILGWKLYELSNDGRQSALIDEGRSVCSGLHFAIETSTAGLTCGRAYKAVAQLGFGDPGEVVIHNSCH